MDSGRGSAGRGDASDTREPGFESSHHQLLLNNRFLKTVEIKGKDAVNGPLKEISINTSTKWLPYFRIVWEWRVIPIVLSQNGVIFQDSDRVWLFKITDLGWGRVSVIGHVLPTTTTCVTFFLSFSHHNISLSLSFSLSLIRSHVLTVIPTREVLRYSFYNAGESSYFTYSFYISTY